MGTAMQRQEGTRAAPRAQPNSNRTGRKLEGTPRNGGDGQGLANALGWFSVGLGLAQLVAPGGMARLVGISDDSKNRNLMRMLGLRELTSGVGILSRKGQMPWMWSRVAGDVMDLALLGNALSSEKNERGRTIAATAAVLGVTMLDVMSGKQLTDTDSQADGSARDAEQPKGIYVRKSVTVNRPQDEIYNYWHDFENLPRFMRHLESVRVTGQGRSHWVAKAPGGNTVEWDAVVTDDRPNERIAWRSVEGADVQNSGSVEFRRAPGDRGTEVLVEMRYDPPGGHIAAIFAKLFREEPATQVLDDLRNFKAVMETGEIVVSDATVERGKHPAQPDDSFSRDVAAQTALSSNA